jgi:L-ascorbate metabolism protein UlaG (beta-lactamase superfamily)
MANPIRFRWLGIAGIEIESGTDRLLVDPYLSRFPMRNLLIGRPAPRPDLVRKFLQPARTVLVSHAHFDHLADVPNVCRIFGATAYGSPNTSAILAAYGIPPERIKTVRPGDAFSAADFEITIFPGRHGRMLGGLPSAGRLPRNLAPPLRLSDYRMDRMHSFRVQAGGISVLVWNDPDSDGVPPADVVFYCPLWGVQAAACILRAAGARMCVPVHWEDMFAPPDRPPRPMIAPPGWRSPWVRRINPRTFAGSLKNEIPDVEVILAQPFAAVPLRKI